MDAVLGKFTEDCTERVARGGAILGIIRRLGQSQKETRRGAVLFDQSQTKPERR